MHLPEDLFVALKTEMQHIPRSLLVAASDELSKSYRSPLREQTTNFMTTDAHRLAYLAVRLPATFAVVSKVLSEVHARMPDFQPNAVCDIGAGPGTASWAAAQVFDSLQNFSLYEKDAGWLTLGKKLMFQAHHLGLKQADWQSHDLLQAAAYKQTDLVVLSYVINELPVEVLNRVVDEAWQVTKQVLVIIEPGTPHGFERIRAARARLIESGAHLVAPCPHAKACPMAGGDWCHFPERLERSAIHMSVKEVNMGYEDEKYSYVVASKSPVALPQSRILRHPQKHSGHMELFLCGQNGLEKRTLSRKLGELYKRAKKLDWGDIFEG